LPARIFVAAVAAIALAAVAAPAAHATTVSVGAGGTLVVTAAPGERNSLGLQADAAGSGRLVVYEGGDATLTGPAGVCEPSGDYALLCDWTPAAGVSVDLGDGDDRGYVSEDLPKTAHFTLAGGPGDDRLQASLDGQPTSLDGGPGKDELDGGPGADALTGGDGPDTLEGRGGPDTLLGGAGDDLLDGDGTKAAAADTIDGGPGYDAIEADWTDSSLGTRTQPVSVTLAGGADDGRAGEGDDVRGVERIVAYASAHLVGTDAAEDLEVFQVNQPSVLSGAGGNDTLKGSDGTDAIDGGAGDDAIDAGYGDDAITGGPGRDTISADSSVGDCGPLWCKFPFGNDTIDAVDGERDSISCGAGTDTVRADAIDVVAPDCETVIVAGAGAGSGAPGGGGAPATPSGLSASVARVKLATALAHGVTVRVNAPAAGKLIATAKHAASRSRSIKAAGPTSVVLRFSKAERRRARHARALKLTITVRFTPRGGAPLARTLTATLKR
jgi:Ca2+-binding RTX toxin-like protein